MLLRAKHREMGEWTNSSKTVRWIVWLIWLMLTIAIVYCDLSTEHALIDFMHDIRDQLL